MDYTNIIIPKAVENCQLPDPELRNYYVDLEHRTFWLDEEVTPYLLELVKYIVRWNAEDLTTPVDKRQPIRIFFFSPGGDLDINYALIDTIKMSKTPIIGINIGQCASAAAYIFLSCHKRYMLPHAYFILHQGSGTLSGTFEQICAQMDDYQKQVEELASFVLEHTTYSEEAVAEKIVGEWYIRKDEALENGVVHGIVSDVSMLF
jgi:ATP-dependent protease ClpP protease subunit